VRMMTHGSPSRILSRRSSIGSHPKSSILVLPSTLVGRTAMNVKSRPPLERLVTNVRFASSSNLTIGEAGRSFWSSSRPNSAVNRPASSAEFDHVVVRQQ
jgi:hypothetical protein